GIVGHVSRMAANIGILPAAPAEQDKLARILYGQCLEQHSIYKGEDGSIGSGRQGQRQNNDGGKDWTLSGHSQGVVQVFDGAVDPAKTPHFSAPFFESSLIAELPPGGESRLRRLHSVEHPGSGFHFQVKTDFVFKLAVKPVSSKVEKESPA